MANEPAWVQILLVLVAPIAALAGVGITLVIGERRESRREAREDATRLHADRREDATRFHADRRLIYARFLASIDSILKVCERIANAVDEIRLQGELRGSTLLAPVTPPKELYSELEVADSALSRAGYEVHLVASTSVRDAAAYVVDLVTQIIDTKHAGHRAAILQADFRSNLNSAQLRFIEE
ncbi:MAG: hypothetical protein GY953_01345, partial [bacterium]|nr:hypothetical protein [bacterium]